MKIKNINKINIMELLKKDYNFKNGLKAVQTEATYKTDKALIQLLMKVLDVKSLADIKTKFSVAELIEKLINNDILLEALVIVLKTDKGEKIKTTDLEELTREEIIEVIQDFFTLSPRLSSLLETGKLQQDSQ